MDKAKLITDRGSLELEVLSYQYPECEEDWDKDWLVVHIKWTGSLAKIELIAPCLLAWELENLANELIAYHGSNTQEELRFEFVEFNLQMSFMTKGSLGHYSINIDVYGEPARIAEHFDVRAESDQSELLAFAQSLRSISRSFPKR